MKNIIEFNCVGFGTGSYAPDSVESLFDNNLNKVGQYGVLLGNPSRIFEFTIKSSCTILAYCDNNYSDSAGSTPSDINLYMKKDNDFVLVKSNIPTKTGKWYTLFDNLKKGTYRITASNKYVKFTEWKIKCINRYAIYQDYKYYTIKSDYYNEEQLDTTLVKLNDLNDDEKMISDLSSILVNSISDRPYNIICAIK